MTPTDREMGRRMVQRWASAVRYWALQPVCTTLGHTMDGPSIRGAWWRYTCRVCGLRRAVNETLEVRDETPF